MKPTIGRIVLFTDRAHPTNGASRHPAIVTDVLDDGDAPALDITVFFHRSAPAPRTSVLHRSQAEGAAFWDWPRLGLP